MSFLTQRISQWADLWNPYDPAQLPSKGKGIEPIVVDDGSVRHTTVRVIIVGFIAFLGWASVAPLDAGVVIEGSVIVSGNRKAVQHPGGGVIQEINVREGARVKKGDVLLKINPLSTEANLSSTEAEYISMLAAESRLLSERTGNSSIKWKNELVSFGNSDARVIEAKQVQQQLFDSRRAELTSQLRILGEQLAGLQAQAASLVKVLAEKRSQMVSIEQQARNTNQLAKEGYVPESQAAELQRNQSALQGDIASLMAQIASNQASISATQLQIVQQRTTFIRDIDVQLTETQKNRDAYQTRIASLKFDRSLTEVRAPVSGIVVGLKTNTVGGVIGAAQVLMEIVPEGGHLIIEAKIPTVSIDKVHAGLESDLRFSAFNQRTTPVIPGYVRLVGADKLTDEKGNDYYLSHVEATDEGQRLLGLNHVQPGMPVEVIVKTGERTFMAYICKPIKDRFARSFKDE
jgi:protease secretion system membrane fusion protein